MRSSRLDYFRILTTTVLVALALLVVMVFAADFAYVSAGSMREILSSPDIRHALALSLATSLAATLLCVLVAVPSAYALSRYAFRGILILDTIVDLLIVAPILVIGVSLLVFFRMGAVWSGSEWFAVRAVGSAIAACGDFFIYNPPGIVLAQFFCSVSFAVRTMRAAFDEIDPRTEQVAMTLGCTRAGAFRRVTLPLARHGILASTVLCWVRAFGIYGSVSIVAGAVRGRTEVLPTAVQLEFSIGRLDTSLAISMLMLAAAALVLVALRVVSGRSIFGTGGGSR